MESTFDTLGREWTDISSEEWREYTFPGKEVIHIDAPTHLHVSESGGHRLLDSVGISHYVPKGWIHLKWEGSPPFVK